MEIKNSIFPEEKEQFPWDEKALQSFQTLIKNQGIKCCMDDIFLLGILRARKFELKRSLELLKNYYEVRLQYPQYFNNLLPSKLQHAINSNMIQLLPQPDQKGRHVLLFDYSNWDISIVNVSDMLRLAILFMDLHLNYHRTQVNKLVIIVNCEGASLSHFLQISPRFLYTIVTILYRDSYQLRYAEIHYLNINVVIKAILSIIIPLLSSKLKERIHFHSDMSTLHEFINPECLPSKYGGKLSNFDPNEASKMVKANEDYFRKNEEYLKIYEEERDRNFTEGKFRYIGDDEDEKVKQFIETSEEKYKCHSEDPEAFMSAMQKDSVLETTKF